MTRMEMESVRFLKAESRRLEAELENLRGMLTKVSAATDGLPRSKRLKSQVEELTIRKVEMEERQRRYETATAQVRLTVMEEIMSTGANAAEQTVMILRYAECLTWKEIAARTHYPLRHLYRLHQHFQERHLTAPAHL